MSTVLVLVDIQNDYFPGGANALWRQTEAAAAAQGVLSRFRAKSLPVVHVRHVNVRAGATFFLPGTPGADIHESVRPIAGEITVEKNFPDSFLRTTLQGHLQSLGAKRLVICGMMSHMCIDTTVRAAKALGYEVVVVHDACATRELVWQGETLPAESVHKAFMAGLSGSFAQMTDAGDMAENMEAFA
jgi:nicotinamidase-related amidase